MLGNKRTVRALKQAHSLLCEHMSVKGQMSTETLIQLSVHDMSHREKINTDKEDNIISKVHLIAIFKLHILKIFTVPSSLVPMEHSQNIDH